MRICSCNCNEKQVSKFMDRMEIHVDRMGGITVEVTADSGEMHETMEPIVQIEDRGHEWVFLAVSRNEWEHLRQKKSCPEKHEEKGIWDNDIRIWSFNWERIAININDILYIDSYQRKTTVHTGSHKYRIKSNLSEEESVLSPRGFIRVHHGYLVKQDKIKRIGRYSLTLIDGTMIPVSKRYQKGLQLNLQEFPRENDKD